MPIARATSGVETGHCPAFFLLGIVLCSAGLFYIIVSHHFTTTNIFHDAAVVVRSEIVALKEGWHYSFVNETPSTQHQNKVRSSFSKTTRRNIRVAYVFAGSARSFPCAKVHWSIKSHLIDALGGEPHVFVRVSTEDNRNTKTGRGKNIQLTIAPDTLNETLKILNPREVQHFQFSSQLEEMQAQFPSLEHEVVRTNDLRRYSMYYHRSMAYRMVVEYERRHALRFDWVILARLDTQWLEPILPIDKYLEDRVWVTETGYDVFNDQFMMIPRNFSDYMYDLNTKIRKSVYCFGGPDVEVHTCDRAVQARKHGERVVNATISMCCADLLQQLAGKKNANNKLGYSELIQFRHLKEGKIPLSLGHFPVFIVRLPNPARMSCHPECFRLQNYNYKAYIFVTGTGLYPYMAPYQWPDSRGSGMSLRDETVCLYMDKAYFPWKPPTALELESAKATSQKMLSLPNAKLSSKAIGSSAVPLRAANRGVGMSGLSSAGLDYSKSLYEQDTRAVAPAMLLNPKDTEVWRIHPTYNLDGCLFYDHVGKVLRWRRCYQHNGVEHGNGGMYDLRQLFILYVVPHLNDPTFPRAMSLRERAREVDYYESIQDFPVPVSTRVMIPSRRQKSLSYGNGFLCLTVSAPQAGADVGLQSCVFSSDVETQRRQLFQTVHGLLAGSHSGSTVGYLRLASNPLLCVTRSDTATSKTNALAREPSSDRLQVSLCSSKSKVDTQLFEFEMITS